MVWLCALNAADAPQKMHGPDRCCSRPSNVVRPRISPEGMVQRHLVGRELFKVRALQCACLLSPWVRHPRTRVLFAFGMLVISGPVPLVAHRLLLTSCTLLIGKQSQSGCVRVVALRKLIQVAAAQWSAFVVNC